MTLIVGIKCAEGIVIAADSRATLGGIGGMTSSQNVTKLERPKENVILAISGSVGLGQRISLALNGHWEHIMGSKNDILDARNEIRETIWREVEPEINHAVAAIPLIGLDKALPSAWCDALIALPLPIKGEPRLLCYNLHGAGEESTIELPFVTIGSGQRMADPFLSFLKKSLWQDKIPEHVSQAALAAIWTIDHVIDYNPYGGIGVPVRVMRLIKKNGSWVAEEMPGPEIDGHRQNYNQAMSDLPDALFRKIKG